MRSEIYRIAITAILMVLPILDHFCHAEEARTLIVYPNAKAPFQRIYTAIIEGIQQTIPTSETLVLVDDIQPVQLTATLQQINPETIIALGRMTAEQVIKSGYRDRLIVAGALFGPDEYSGVSLVIDSRKLLQEIKAILPAVERVFVVDSPNRSHIRIYSESLNGRPSIVSWFHDDPLINSRRLWQLLEQAIPCSDVILLPSQLDRDILYELAQLAWRKKIILLSTNLAHLKEGVLMVFYPDNVEMGRQIGAFSIAYPGQGFESLTGVKIALNPAVARHLGLEIAPDVLTRFEVQVK